MAQKTPSTTTPKVGQWVWVPAFAWGEEWAGDTFGDDAEYTLYKCHVKKVSYASDEHGKCVWVQFRDEDMIHVTASEINGYIKNHGFADLHTNI